MEREVTLAAIPPAHRRWLRPFLHLRYVLGVVFALACYAFIFWALGTGHAVLGGNPAASFIVLFACSLLLAYLEGLQCAILSVEFCKVDEYRKKYPKAVRLHEMVTAGHGVQRFLLGRQFLVIFVVFCLSRVTSFDESLDVSWLPRWVVVGLLETGFIGVMWVLVVAQLPLQIVAATHPFFVMGLPGAYETIQLCHLFELSGVVYVPWMIIKIMRRFLHGDVLPKEKPKECVCECACAHGIKEEDGRCSQGQHWYNKLWKYFLWLRYPASIALLCYSFYVVGYGFHHRLSKFPGGIAAHAIIFPLMVILLAYLEGTQICVLNTVPLDFSDPKWAQEMPRGHRLIKFCQLPRMCERYLVGRQFFTVFVMFLISRITAYDLKVRPEWQGWPNWLLIIFFECGMASGVMVVLVVGSLLPQMLASTYSLKAMQFPGSNFVVYLAVFLTHTGVVYLAWGITKYMKSFLDPFVFPPVMERHGNRTHECTCFCQCGATRLHVEGGGEGAHFDVTVPKAWVGPLDNQETAPGEMPFSEVRSALEKSGNYAPYLLYLPQDPKMKTPTSMSAVKIGMSFNNETPTLVDL